MSPRMPPSPGTPLGAAPLWQADALLDAVGGRFTTPFAATGVSIDSRTLRPGDVFVALRGVTDGHAHVAAALAAGAAGALVRHVPDGLDEAAPLLLVADTGAALTALGAAGRARFASPVVAVTGSVGKTTTKEMLRLTLAEAGPAHAAEASHNNHWGVPLTLARLPVSASGCAVEIGMNHAGEIAPLSRLARPDVAVITAIGTAHIGHMGSEAAIAAEKASIAAGLTPPGGTLVVPAATRWDDVLRAAAGEATVLRFGEAEDADTRVLSVRATADFSDVTLALRGATIRLRLNAPGRHMVANALAALTATEAAGLDVWAAAARLAAFVPGGGRGQRRAIAVPGGTALLLDESYNASTASVRAALAVLALQPARRRLVVLGDMRELGSHSAAEHCALAAPVAEVADLVFACGVEMRALFDALPAARRGAFAMTAAELAPQVRDALRAEDAVLVKGSNGMRLSGLVAVLEAGGTEATRGAAA